MGVPLKTGGPDTASQIVPFIAGAGNSLLFGLPEAAIKGLGNEQTKKIVEEYKAKNKGYGAGEVAGTVGSMFIPGGAIARGVGAGAKAIGATKAAQGLEKIAKVASGPMGVKQGLAVAAEQALPRAAAEVISGEKPEDVAKNAALTLGFGGAVGAAGKLIGKGVKALGETGVGKTIKDESEKVIEDAVLSGADVNTGAIVKQMNESARRLGIDRVGHTFNNVEDLKKKTSDFIVKNGLLNKVKREEFLSEQSPLWQKVADDYNAQPVDFASDDILARIKSDPSVQEYINRAGVGEKQVDDMILTQVLDLQKRPDFNQSKSYLVDMGRLGNKAGTEAGDAQKAIAETMHDMIDAKAMELSPELAKLKADYPIIKLLKRASGKEQSIVENPIREGSDTFQKFATNAALGGAVGGTAAPDENKVLGAIGGAVAAPFLSRSIGKLATQGMAGLASKAPAAAKAVGAVAKPAAEKAGLLGGVQMPPDEQVEFAEKMPNPNFDPSTPETAVQPPEADPLQSALEDVWKIEDPTGQIEASSPESKQEFFDHMREQLSNADGSINYLRAAKVLTRGNADDEKNLQESYQTLQKIRQAMPNAVKLLTIGNSKASIDKGLVVNTVADVLKKGGMEGKEAQKVVENILSNPIKSPQEKAALVYDLLQKYNPSAFGEGGILHRAGVLS